MIGGLFFGHPNEAVFTERAERIVVAIAAQAAIAMDHAKLIQALRERETERAQFLESERAARSEAERLSHLRMSSSRRSLTNCAPR